MNIFSLYQNFKYNYVLIENLWVGHFEHCLVMFIAFFVLGFGNPDFEIDSYILKLYFFWTHT